MREIKFRAFENGTMYRQVRCGGLFNGIPTAPTTWNEEKGDWLNLTGQPHTIVMQYTGVKDMHGVEIYEGDLVRIPRWNDVRSRKVFYHAGMFKVENGESGFSLATTMGDLACEVVGNIYEGLRK